MMVENKRKTNARSTDLWPINLRFAMRADSHLVLYECGWDSIKYSSVCGSFILKKEHNNPNIVVCFNFGFATLTYVVGKRICSPVFENTSKADYYFTYYKHLRIEGFSGALSSLLCFTHSIYSFLFSIFILYIRFVNFVNLTLNS